ncbi:MAG: QueT transporter family protein [Christensenellales bacterium]
MFKKLLTTRSLCLSAIIAALYAALTLLLAPISYGNIQCRVSEAFTVLPMVLPQSIPGLFVGCLIANIFSPSPSILDIVFGSLTTLIAACGTYALRKKPVLAAACPIVANGVIVGLMLGHCCTSLPAALIQMGEVAIGELGAVFLGMVLLTVLKSRVDFNKISKM